jgi:hypothetical protein
MKVLNRKLKHWVNDNNSRAEFSLFWRSVKGFALGDLAQFVSTFGGFGSIEILPHP